MRLFAFRKPPSLTLLIIAAVFALLFIYAFRTGEFLVLPSRTHQGQVVRKMENPRLLDLWMLYSVVIALAGTSLAFLRIVPLEDGIAAWKAAIKNKVNASSANTSPAPPWAYAFLAAFVALIVYLGYVFMYRE
jgi:hypothetical protein